MAFMHDGSHIRLEWGEGEGRKGINLPEASGRRRYLRHALTGVTHRIVQIDQVRSLYLGIWPGMKNVSLVQKPGSRENDWLER